MTRKTKPEAAEGGQDILITREFELPVQLLFRAYTEIDLIEKWMGTRVLLLENKKHGAWQFETTNPQGEVVFRAHGVIHAFEPDKQITRTFEMEGGSFPVQLEFLDFHSLDADRSMLIMQIIFKSSEHRDRMLKLPFAQGISMAHDRLQQTLDSLNSYKTQ